MSTENKKKKDLKPASVYYGHYKCPGERMYYANLVPGKTRSKVTETVKFLSQEGLFNAGAMQETLSKIDELAEARGYQVFKRELSKVNVIYKQ